MLVEPRYEFLRLFAEAGTLHDDREAAGDAFCFLGFAPHDADFSLCAGEGDI